MLLETRPELKDKNGINIGLLFPLHSTLIISLLCLEISLSLLHMHTHVHTYMHTPTHAEQPYNRFDRSFGFIKGLREFLIAKRSTERYACVCVYVHKHIFHQLSYCCSVAQSCLTLWPPGLQHATLPCPSPSPRVCSNSCPLGWWCHPASHPLLSLFLPPSVFPSIRVFSSELALCISGHSIGVSTSASVLPKNIQDWSPLGLISLISLQSKGLSRVLSNTTVQKIQSFSKEFAKELRLRIGRRKVLRLKTHAVFKPHGAIWSLLLSASSFQ